MNRLTTFFTQQRKTGRKALSVFLTAGFPSLDSTAQLVPALQHAGADIIEIGIPFSDPIADGPVIQHSSEIALKNGVTLKKIFDLIEEIGPSLTIPIILMGYANPIFSFGYEKFIRTCAERGIDGVIIPDLGLEEGRAFRELARQHDIATVLLVTPTTSPKRIKEIDTASTGFLYCVSLTGVTGSRPDTVDSVGEFLTKVRHAKAKNPLLAGFGISTPDEARRISRFCDGVIVGSSLLNVLERTSGNHILEQAAEFTNNLRSAIDTIY